MKKHTSLLLLLSLFILFASCGVEPTSELSPEQEKTTISHTNALSGFNSAGSETRVELVENEPPVYSTGSIVLEPEEFIGSDFCFKPTKRRIYYKIPGTILDLVPESAIIELFEKDKDIYTERDEMALVTLVKYCDIPKEDFERAVEKMREWSLSSGVDLSLEDNELPNADIIYTFDNEIINEYYRRQ